MGASALLALLLSLGIQAFGAELQLSPETLTVMRGAEARFTCRTSNTEWTVMVWSLNDKPVLTISNASGMLPSIDPKVTAMPLSPGSPRKGWVFVLNGTERQHQGQVACDLQNIERKTASLFVQEKGSVEVLGDDRLAFKDQLVVFECRAAGWHPQPSLHWQVGKEKVSWPEYNLSVEETSRNLFSASSSLPVMAARSSRVDCLASVSALPQPESSSVHLTVVSEVLEDNCTVPLAITATLLAIVLFLLICVSVLWFRHRTPSKQSSQQDTRLEPSSGGGRGGGVGGGIGGGGSGGSANEEVTRWRVNAGYTSDETSDAVYNELITETGRRTGRQMDSGGFHEVPDVVSSSDLSVHSESRAQSSPNSTNIRRITTV